MKKGQVIGLVVTGLAVIGGVAVYNWVKKPKRNDDGFFNATGTTSKLSPMRCTRCRTTSGGTYVPRWDSDPQCDFKAGERCLTNAV